MKLLSRTLGLGIVAAAIFAGCAAAATLAFGSTTLSAGSATVTSCGVTSLSATRNVDNAGDVTRLDVSGIPAACSGQTLLVSFVGIGNLERGNGSATIGNCGTTCSASVTSFSTTISAASFSSYSFAVTGS